MLPYSENQVQIQRIVDPVVQKMEKCRTKSEYSKTCSFYQKQYFNYVQCLTKVFKNLMKKSDLCPDSQNQVFKFFAACIRGNVYRTKLSSELENEPEKICFSIL